MKGCDTCKGQGYLEEFDYRPYRSVKAAKRAGRKSYRVRCSGCRGPLNLGPGQRMTPTGFVLWLAR